MKPHRGLALVALSFVLGSSSGFGDVRDLRWRYSGITNDLHGVASGGGKIVAVGSQGAVLTSVDTLTWTSQVSGTTNDLWGVAYGNGLFVAVGGGTNGEIMTSPDGVLWTRQTAGITNALRAVCYGTTSFVAIGTQGAILASTNGTTWTRRPTGLPRNLYAVTSGPLYVAVGEAGSLLSSVDGLSWTVRNSGVLFDLYCVASDPPQNAFMAAGQQGTVITGDGINWTAITSPTEQDLLAVAGASDLNSHGTFALGGTSGLFICLDDIYVSSWHEQSSWSSANIRGLCHLDGEFLGVGDHGMIGCGLVWFRRLSNTTYNLNAAAYGGGRYVAVGDSGSITTSVDAQTWTPATAGSQTLNWITYGAGRFVAVGNGTDGFPVAVSTNGLNWTNFTLTPPPYSYQNLFTHVAYGNGAFIASGYYFIPAPFGFFTLKDVIALSADGMNWQMYTNLPAPRYDNSGVPLAVGCTGPNTFFLCGSNISTSSDGITWTPRANIAVPWLAASSNLFVGLDGAGSSVYSPDGTNWTVVPTAATTDGNNLTYGDGSFITVGLPNIFYGSTDGIDWVRGVFGEIYTQHIAHGFNSFIVVGVGGLLLQSSPSVLPPRLQTSHSTNGLNLVLISEPGRPVDVQTSSDLSSWTFLTNVTPIEGSTTISVPAVGQQKFFRAATH